MRGDIQEADVETQKLVSYLKALYATGDGTAFKSKAAISRVVNVLNGVFLTSSRQACWISKHPANFEKHRYVESCQLQLFQCSKLGCQQDQC